MRDRFLPSLFEDADIIKPDGSQGYLTFFSVLEATVAALQCPSNANKFGISLERQEKYLHCDVSIGDKSHSPILTFRTFQVGYEEPFVTAIERKRLLVPTILDKSPSALELPSYNKIKAKLQEFVNEICIKYHSDTLMEKSDLITQHLLNYTKVRRHRICCN